MTEDEVIEKMARAIFRAQAITTTEWGDADEDIRESCRVYARAESEAAQATLEDEQAAHAETLRLWQEEKARNASARAEGWKAGRDAAAKVARERSADLRCANSGAEVMPGSCDEGDAIADIIETRLKDIAK